MTRIPPLNWQVPIVDSSGRPTPDFMRYFQQLGGNDAGFESDVVNLQAADAALQAADIALQAVDADLQAQIDALAVPPASGGAVMPLVDGAEPPVFITDGAGALIAVPWSD